MSRLRGEMLWEQGAAYYKQTDRQVNGLPCDYCHKATYGHESSCPTINDEVMKIQGLIALEPGMRLSDLDKNFLAEMHIIF